MTMPNDVAVAASQQSPGDTASLIRRMEASAPATSDVMRAAAAAGVVTGQAGAASRSAAWHVGNEVRTALGGAPPPLLALQTTYSFLRGTVSPEDWAAALAGLHGAGEVEPADHRGANHPPTNLALTIALQAGAFTRATQVPPPAPVYRRSDSDQEQKKPWAALADLGDLPGLPECIDQFGRRIAVGATVPLQRGPGEPVSLALFLAPNHSSYKSLCTLLSWRLEHQVPWEAWLAGLTHDAPAMDHLVVLVADSSWGDLFAWHGAEVYRWLTGPDEGHVSGYPPVFAPLLTDLRPGRNRRHEVRACIQERSHVRLHVEAARVPHQHTYLTDLPHLLERMAGHEEAIERGRGLLARCTFAPGEPQANGHPKWLLPPALHPDPDGELRQRCLEGVRQRYGGCDPPAVRARLAYELDIFTKKGFAPYILAVWLLTRDRQTCGRGSAASSLVCYALGITNVDPLKYHLVFERFMSEERFDPPDIDVDFAHDERDAVLEATIRLFGSDHVALVATHQTLHHQGALREAARAFDIDRETTTVAQRSLSLKRTFGVGEGPGEQWPHLLAVAEDLVRSPTNYGVHCGGIVITEEPIREVVPIHPAAKQLHHAAAPAIAWEKDGAERLGLVKIDFLGNRSLGVVRDTLNDLREDGITIDPWKWKPEEDLLAKQLIARGLTIGCFYIESPAMRLLNAKAGETDFDRLTLHSSIIRPAANNWINTYLERFTEFRKTGKHQDEWYPHPALRALLSDSFGVLSYQEDLMLISRDLAGFTIKQQNQLRKALGRSDTPQRLAAQQGSFFAGCEARGVTPTVSRLVWDMIVSFAGYSFTKAHSASYVQVSFQAACLKAHNPAHFMARVISNGGGFYGPCAYVEEARRRRVEILPPCVVSGEWDTRRTSPRAMRLGFQLLRGVHRRTIDRVMKERARRPFAGVGDVWRRCHPSVAEMEAFLWSGAFNGLVAELTPSQRAWLVDQAIQVPRTMPDVSDQLEFDFAAETHRDPTPPTDLPAISQRALDRRAWNALGILPRAHPFALWGLPRERQWWCADVKPANRGRVLTILAWVITSKSVLATQLKARDGSLLAKPSIRSMAFVTLEDEGGIAESVWFPDVYQRSGPLIDSGQPFLVTGRVMVEYGVATLEISHAKSFD